MTLVVGHPHLLSQQGLLALPERLGLQQKLLSQLQLLLKQCQLRPDLLFGKTSCPLLLHENLRSWLGLALGHLVILGKRPVHLRLDLDGVDLAANLRLDVKGEINQLNWFGLGRRRLQWSCKYLLTQTAFANPSCPLTPSAWAVCMRSCPQFFKCLRGFPCYSFLFGSSHR